MLYVCLLAPGAGGYMPLCCMRVSRSQVQVDDHTCTGVGPNKKLAKRHAAEAMLQLLGYNKPSPQPSKPAIKMQGDVRHISILS